MLVVNLPFCSECFDSHHHSGRGGDKARTWESGLFWSK